MKYLCWNVRGLGNPRNVRHLKNKLRSVHPRLVFLMETKLSLKQMEGFIGSVGFFMALTLARLVRRVGFSWLA